MTRSNRRPQKEHKRCFFCGEPNPMSDEHAWPRWLGRGADVDPTQRTRTLGYHLSGEDELTEAPTVITEKKGSVLTTRIREVCKICNSGWMSRLESDAKPLLERLWATSYPFGDTSFDTDDAARLATWASKTAWVHERANERVVTASSAMRRYLMDNRLPPGHTSVWAARHTGRTNFGLLMGRLQAINEDDRFDSANHRNVLHCVLTFRGISLVVRTDDDWGVPELVLPSAQWRRMWPASASVSWPPARPVTDDDVQAVGMRYSWLKHPEVSNFIQHSDGVQTIRRN